MICMTEFYKNKKCARKNYYKNNIEICSECYNMTDASDD